jgi:hypothetical protein
MTALSQLWYRRRHLALIGNPERWPCYPFLPMRRVVEAATEHDLGVLYDLWGLRRIPGFSATVFRVNLLMLPATEEGWLEVPREVFDTFDELFEAGWRVD